VFGLGGLDKRSRRGSRLHTGFRKPIIDDADIRTSVRHFRIASQDIEILPNRI
jgi:hypothetical protein